MTSRNRPVPPPPPPEAAEPIARGEQAVIETCESYEVEYNHNNNNNRGGQGRTKMTGGGRGRGGGRAGTTTSRSNANGRTAQNGSGAATSGSVPVADKGVAITHTTATAATTTMNNNNNNNNSRNDEQLFEQMRQQRQQGQGQPQAQPQLPVHNVSKTGAPIDANEDVLLLLNLCQDVTELKEHYQHRRKTVETPLGGGGRQQRQSRRNTGRTSRSGADGGDGDNNDYEDDDENDPNAMSPAESKAWDNIRQWLENHSSTVVRRQAILEVRGEYDVTALHVLCRHGNPPLDILEEFLQAAGTDACQQPDSFDWLPLHYACGSLASTFVLEKIIQCYPAGRAKQDRRGRTPLHFVLGSAARQREEWEESHHDRTQWHSIYDPEFDQPQTDYSKMMWSDDLLLEIESTSNSNNNGRYQGVDGTMMKLLVGNGAPTRKDEGGMVPLHYACAYLALTEEALRILIESHPPSLVALDGHGRSPLHFTMGNSDKPASPMVTKVLLTMSSIYQGGGGGVGDNSQPQSGSNGGGATATAVPREDMHAASPLSLQSQLVNLADREGHLPIHLLAMSAKRSSLRGGIGATRANRRALVGPAASGGDGLAHGGAGAGAATASSAQPWTRKESNKLMQQQHSAKKCLRLYLDAHPEPTASFLTALQTLPSWLRDAAVTCSHVQSFLNQKITQRFLTTTLILDFYVLIMIIVFFRLTTTNCITYRQCYDKQNDLYPCEMASVWYPGDVTGTNYELNCGGYQLFVLYVGATYFFLREIIQALSLQSLNLFRMWYHDPKNWLDMISFGAVYFLTATMQFGLLHNTPYNDVLQIGAALTTGLLWGSLIAFLKSTLVEFAVFVQGVIFVVRKLGAFCMCVAVIIVAFALMFTTEFQCSIYCTPSFREQIEELGTEGDDNVIIDEDFYEFPWCDLREALVKCLTMMVGQVDELDFPTNVSKAMYLTFGFLVTLLLFNVLIAIVIDSYSVIRNERAAIVFWSNRLDFVAEMDAILSGPWKWRTPQHSSKTNHLSRGTTGTTATNNINARRGIGGGGGIHNPNSVQARYAVATSQEIHPYDYYWWKNVLQVFEDQELRKCSFEYIFYFIIRFVTAIIIVPTWLLLGLLTAGLLWPPQIRNYLLVQKTTEKYKSDDALHGFYELTELKENMASFKLKLKAQMKVDREEVKSFGEAADDVKSSMMSDLKQIKEVMQSMLEVRRAMGPPSTTTRSTGSKSLFTRRGGGGRKSGNGGILGSVAAAVSASTELRRRKPSNVNNNNRGKGTATPASAATASRTTTARRPPAPQHGTGGGYDI